MKVKVDPRDLVRNVVMAEYRPFDDSIEIVREKHAGKDAAFAVAFEDRSGVQRRGLIGLCRHHSKTWQRSGGFMGSSHVTGPRDAWMTWGGWGGRAAGQQKETWLAGGLPIRPP